MTNRLQKLFTTIKRYYLECEHNNKHIDASLYRAVGDTDSARACELKAKEFLNKLREMEGGNV